MAAITLKSLLLESELYTYEYFLQEDVCRLCWSRNSFTEIVNNLVHLDGVKLELIDLIRDCLDLDMSDDKYPNKICDECWDIVKKFYSFKSYCKEADKKLKSIVDNGSVTTFADGLCGPLSESENETDENLPNMKIEIKKEVTNSISDYKCEEPNIKVKNRRSHKPKLEITNFQFDTAENMTRIKTNVKNEVTNTISDNKHTARSTDVKSKRICKPRLIKAEQRPKNLANYCHTCCIQFDGEKQFNAHNSYRHGIVNNSYKCFGCEKHFRTYRSRFCHELKFCTNLKLGYKCRQCERYLPSRKLYEAHMRYHAGKGRDVELPENIFKCKKCNESFKTKDNLKSHMATHKTDDHFVCETCGHVFLRRDYLQKHIMIHAGVKKHECTYCGLKFLQKGSLNVHLRKHTGERPYQCSLCPQRCVSSSNLLAHKRRHLGIKKFQCAYCDKKFGYKLSLSEHIASAHQPAQKQQCEECGAIYARKKCLKRHIAKKHGGGDVKINSENVDVTTENLGIIGNNL